jgi:hypothetical protein
VGDTGRYLYAVCRDLDPAVLADLPGLDGGRLELVEHRGIEAVVSTVDLDEYGEESLRANFEDLAWLERAARGHDTVVQGLAAAAPTAPLRLATICLDDDAVRRRLVEWHAALTQILDRIEGRMEWSVKVYADLDATPAPAATVPAGGGGGAAYLQRKKAESQSRAAGESAALDSAERVHLALDEVSVASRRLPAQDPRLTGHTGLMVHNGAYLVEIGRADDFAAAADRCAAAEPGVVVDLRGPWPPYSFAMLDQR